MDSTRKGIRIRGHRGNAEVRQALIRFARWLRDNYDFPIRVPVYLFPSSHILTQDGEAVSASFFAPFDPLVEPYIRIATGDYWTLKRKYGRNNALAAFIVSLSHEVVHYLQWAETGTVWEAGVANKALSMLHRYQNSVARP